MAQLKDLLVNGASRFLNNVNINGVTTIEGVASSATNKSSSLIVSSQSRGSSGNVSLELWRGSNASWQIQNSSGSLYFKNNYTTTVQTTYSQQSLKLDYNTGYGSIPGFTVGKTSSDNATYKFYVNGTSYLNGTTSSQSVNPITTNAYNLGTSSLRWKEVHIGTADSYGNTSTPVYWNNGIPAAITSYGGNAATATALTSSAGDANTPIYFSSGKPSAITSVKTAVGGTGQTSWTANRLVYTSSATQLASTANIYTAGTNLEILATSGGYKLTDSTSTRFGGIYYDGTNLWIGATGSAEYPHKGAVYISTGWTGTLGTDATANACLYMSVPTIDNTTYDFPSTKAHSVYPIAYRATSSSSSVRGVYVDGNGGLKCLSYSLNATISAGTATQAAYYKTANNIASTSSLLFVTDADSNNYVEVNATSLCPTSNMGSSLGESDFAWNNLFVKKIIAADTTMYGSTLPSSGLTGQLFFRTNDYELDDDLDVNSISIYKDSTRTFYVNNTGRVNSNSLFYSSYSNAAGFVQENPTTNVAVSFGVGSGGYNRGIYDSANGEWAFWIDASGNYRIGNDSIGGGVYYAYTNTNFSPVITNAVDLGNSSQKFRNLLLSGGVYSNGHSGAIGQVIAGTNGSSAVSTTISTWVNVSSITLTEGIYLLFAGVKWGAQSAYGTAYMEINSASTGFSFSNSTRFMVSTYIVGSMPAGLTQTRYFNVGSSGSTLYLWVRQSAVTMNCYPYMYAVRIA